MRRILAAILLTLLITAGASAQVVHATGKLLTQRWETTLDSGTRLTSPVVSRPARGQVLFYIYSGASYTQALALCGDPKMAQPLAEALAKAGAGTPLSETSAEFTEEDGQAVVSLEQGGGHIGAAKATRAFNVPAYIEAIQGLGFKPIIVLRLPLYGTIDQSGFQTESSPTSRYCISYGTQPVSPVTFTATTSSIGLPIAVAALLLPLLGGVIGMLAGIAVAKNGALELSIRRQRYTKFVMGGALGSIAIHAPLFLGLIVTQAYKPYADVWFGTRSALTFAPLIMLAPLTMMLILPFANRTEKKLFGAAPDAPKLPPPPGDPEARKRARKISSLVYLGLAVPAFALFFFLPPAFRMMPLFVLIFGNLIFQSFVLPKFGKPTLDDRSDAILRLQALAEKLASHMGSRVRNVKLQKSATSATLCHIAAEPSGDIVVSHRFLQVMSDDEASFFLASSLSDIADGRPLRRNLMIFGPALLMLPVFLCGIYFGQGHPRVLPILFAPFVLFIPFAFLVIRPATEKATTSADRAALKVTGDYPAARAAILKMWGIAPEREDAESANAFASKRLANLRNIAQELGIGVGGARF